MMDTDDLRVIQDNQFIDEDEEEEEEQYDYEDFCKAERDEEACF